MLQTSRRQSNEAAELIERASSPGQGWQGVAPARAAGVSATVPAMATDATTLADVLIPLGAAFIGATAGAGASLFTSRREMTRAQRIRMYDELLPPVLERLEKNAEQYRRGGRDGRGVPIGVGRPALQPLVRAATIAGRRERRRAEELVDLADNYWSTAEDYHAITTRRSRSESPKQLEEPNADQAELHQQLATLSSRQARKANEFSSWLHDHV
jgi:hypothetical protein